MTDNITQDLNANVEEAIERYDEMLDNNVVVFWGTISDLLLKCHVLDKKGIDVFCSELGMNKKFREYLYRVIL